MSQYGDGTYKEELLQWIRHESMDKSRADIVAALACILADIASGEIRIGREP